MAYSQDARTTFLERMRELGVLHHSRLDGVPSARTMARQAGVSPTTVGNWLKGTRLPDSLDSLLRVIRCLLEESQRRSWLTREVSQLLDEEWWRERYADVMRAHAEDSRDAVLRSHARVALTQQDGSFGTDNEWTSLGGTAQLQASTKAQDQSTLLFAAPPLTGNEIDRPILMQKLAEAVRSSGGELVGPAIGLLGAGGFGKSTLARLLVHHRDIRNEFVDGIFWVTVGDETYGPDLAERINDVTYLLGSGRPLLSDPLLAGTELGRTFGQKRILLVVDDVWSASQLEPFMLGGPSVVRLITTRLASVLPATVRTVPVDAMEASEAKQLLTSGLPAVSLETAQSLLDVTGRWAMLLALVNGAARSDLKAGGSPEESLDLLLAQLKGQGPQILDVDDDKQRHLAVASTVDVSLRRLSAGERDRFLELAVFQPGVDIPRQILERYWLWTGGLTSFQTHRLCQRLADLALANNYRLDPPRIAIHDVLHTWLRYRQQDRLVELYRSMLLAHRHLVPNEGGLSAWWRLPADETYLWSAIGAFLYAADLKDELERLLREPDYLTAKLRYVGPAGLEADLNFSSDPLISALRDVIRQDGHLLGHLQPEGSVAATLASRLPEHEVLEPLRQRFEQALAIPHLRLAAPSPDLPHPRLIRALSSPHGYVTGLLTHDETHIFSAASDYTMQLWDVDAGRCLETTQTPPGLAVNFSSPPSAPDHSWTAEPRDESIAVIDPSSGELLHELIGHSGIISELISTRDGRWLVSAGFDSTVRIWNPVEGSCQHVLTGHRGHVSVLAFAPDDTWLVSAGQDGTLQLWDVKTGNHLLALVGHTSRIESVAMAPDGTWLASGSADSTVRIWDPRTGVCKYTLNGHSPYVTGAVGVLLALHGGAWLASAGFDGIVRLWEVATGALVDVLTGHSGWVGALAAAPDSRWLASAGYDGKVRIWNLSTDAASNLPALGHRGRITELVASPDSSWLASSGDDGEVRIWDPAAGRCIEVLTGHEGWVGSLASSPNGTWLASTGQDGVIRIWDPMTGTLLHSLTGNTSKSEALVASPDDKWVSSSCLDGAVRVWDTRTGEMINELNGGYGPLAVAADASWLAFGGEDHIIRRWAMPSGIPLASFEADHVPSKLLVAPDGSWLASVGDQTIQLWDTSTWRLKHTLAIEAIRFHDDWATAALIAPNSSWLAAASNSGGIWIWSTADGSLAHTLAGHTELVSTLAVDPSGSWIASAGEDGTVRLWNVASGVPVASIRVDDQLSNLTTCGRLIVAAGSGVPYIMSLR
jgi:WD40 repeat protein